jgi:hypothetical protein
MSYATNTGDTPLRLLKILFITEKYLHKSVVKLWALAASKPKLNHLHATQLFLI